jgi:HEAT repeat protein
MDVPQSSPSHVPSEPNSAQSFGTLGPNSDVAIHGPDPASGAGTPARVARFAPLAAVVIGVLAALLVVLTGRANVARPGVKKASANNRSQIDSLQPQRQAEALLEQAIGHSDGAVDQISSRVDGWQGKLNWNSQIATLTTAALNSNDLRVRESGVAVELAAYGLSKNSKSLDYVLKTADSPDHAQKIWALWALGLMANQGVEPEQIVQVLTAHLKDRDEDSRRWAVEGLALVGSDQTIDPLLKAMHDDPAPGVRERAACAIAQSGMFTQEQRMSVVPKLLNYTDDSALDSQTHAWAFQALGDITHQHLPNDANAWRTWYEQNSGQ